jgi:LuxR family maltose regulon positive regulatory protein
MRGRALDLVGEGDQLGRGSAAALLGLAYWTTGDLDAAHRWQAEAMASLEKAGHLSDVIGCALSAADIRIAQGRLREAMSTYERGLQRAAEQAGPVLRGAADMHVGMSELLRERDDLGAAMQHLLASTAMQHLLASTELGELACRRTRIAGASRWPGYGRLKEISAAHSACSTRRSAGM